MFWKIDFCYGVYCFCYLVFREKDFSTQVVFLTKKYLKTKKFPLYSNSICQLGNLEIRVFSVCSKYSLWQTLALYSSFLFSLLLVEALFPYAFFLQKAKILWLDCKTLNGEEGFIFHVFQSPVFFIQNCKVICYTSYKIPNDVFIHF